MSFLGVCSCSDFLALLVPEVGMLTKQTNKQTVGVKAIMLYQKRSCLCKPLQMFTWEDKEECKVTLEMHF